MKPIEISIQKESISCESEKEQFNPENHWRVKVFKLSNESTWEDRGTGYVRLSKVEEKFVIEVTSEIGDNLLVSSPIHLVCDLSKQKETIITWTEQQGEVEELEIALSFQNLDDAQNVWQILCAIQNKDPKITEDYLLNEEQLLPLPKFENLPTLVNTVTEAVFFPQMRKGLILQFLREGGDYLQEVLKLFTLAEKAKMCENLILIFCFFKGIIGFNCQELLEFILNNDNYIVTFGILEYDPDINIIKDKNKFQYKKIS